MDVTPVGPFCPLCGGAGETLGKRDGVAVRECLNGHDSILLSWAWKNEAEYLGLYTKSNAYHVAEQQAEGQTPFWQRDTEHLAAAMVRIETLTAVTTRPLRGLTVADIGAGTGAFVALATAYGAAAEGWEPNFAVVDRAIGIGRRLRCGSWEDLENESRYDYVTMWDVFEHLTRPFTCLQKMKKHLSPGGQLVIELPEWGCPRSVSDGIQWKHIRPRQHLFLPSDGAAREMFKRAGLYVEASVRPLRGTLGKIAYFLSPEQQLAER